MNIQAKRTSYGNTERNSLTGPCLKNLDFSILKRFILKENLTLQFRAEVFNILNHANFNIANPIVYTAATGGPSPTARVITSTATTSRQIQFGLKLLW